MESEQCEQTKGIGPADPSKAIASASNTASESDSLGRKRRREDGDEGEQDGESSIDPTEQLPPDPDAQIVNYVVSAIQDGSDYLLQHQSTIDKEFSQAGWFKLDVSRLSAEQLYLAHGQNVEKAHLFSRYSMLVECLFAVVITLPNGRLWGERKEGRSENERRRFRSRVGAFIINLVNDLAATLSEPGDKPEIAYCICFALIGEDASSRCCRTR